MMKLKCFGVFLPFFLIVNGLMAQSQLAAKDPDVFANVNREGVMLKGYDPVAFFTESMPVKGKAQFQSEYKGAIYRFATQEHKQLFDANPEKYKVWFGGWCAWAVSNGYTASADISTWSIVDGKLVVQYSKSVARRFAADPEGNLKKALKYWPYVAANEGKKINTKEIDN